VTVLHDVYDTRDIESVEHFAYNQFYVLYDRFVSLDEDHKFRLTRAELANLINADVLTQRMVDRIFATNLVTHNSGQLEEGKTKKEEFTMSYRDWVVFVKVRFSVFVRSWKTS